MVKENVNMGVQISLQDHDSIFWVYTRSGIAGFILIIWKTLPNVFHTDITIFHSPQWCTRIIISPHP